jgi:hypothetical protein
MRLTAALLALFLIAATDRHGSSVPLEIEHGVVFVSCEVDGIGPLLFVIDPGAGDFLTAYGASRLRDKPVRRLVVGTAMVSATMPVADGDSNQLVPNHDPSRGTIAGSVGPALLKRYAMELDYAESRMTLSPLPTFTPPPKAARLPFTLDDHGMPVIEAQIDRSPAHLELDVRAPSSMLFAPFLKSSGVGTRYAGAPVVKQTPMGVAHAIHELSIGGHRLSSVTAWFSGAASGKFASATVAGLLGNNVWEHFVVTLDYRRHTAYLALPRPRTLLPTPAKR